SGKVVRVDIEGDYDTGEFDFEGVSSVEVGGDGYLQMVVTTNYDTLVEKLAGYDINDLVIRETSLEDVFLHFYGIEEDEEGVETEPNVRQQG
ncbi:MAG: ABC transporter ATP-binding protein, partial [Halobacteria archaeon]|nr:ABC transporter ATP-binding protein [Halobacteria archaeon]